jgi:hypothetical protein
MAGEFGATKTLRGTTLDLKREDRATPSVARSDGPETLKQLESVSHLLMLGPWGSTHNVMAKGGPTLQTRSKYAWRP